MTQGLVFLGASSSSGIGALGLSGSAFLIQLITFILAFLILRRYAFKPIIKLLDERRKTINEGVNLGEDMKKKSAELEDEIAEKLRAARLEADKIVGAAQQEARGMLQETEESARAKAEAIVKEADERIKQNTQLARKRLEKELVGLVSDVTEAIIDEKIDLKKDSALIDKALSKRGAV
jgi:F-type H+-transporting ATPase subunit b